MKKIKMSLVAAMAAAAATTGASAGMLDEMISNPQLDIELRPRYEYADVDGNRYDSNGDGSTTAADKKADAAKAFTVRTAIGVKMGLFGVDGLNAQLQGMSVDHFGLVRDYAPERSAYDTIADPAQSRMTQANISYTSGDFTGIFGRKMVVLDNARFIGNVGWRQMPQTYDLAAAVYNWEGLNLLGAYVTKVNKINGSVLDTGSVLLHVAYEFMPELKVTVYDYMIQNFADQPGIRATGTLGLGDGMKVKYTAEYAAQLDPTMTSDDNPIVADVLGATTNDPDKISQDADYYNIAADLVWNGLTVGAGYEVLGAADDPAKGNAFSTPLATLHAMNGWADVFLKTPKEGLCDLSFKLGYNMGEYGKILGVYHSFTSDKDNASGDSDLGNEVDVAYNYKIEKNLGLLLKGAFYSAGDNSFGKFDTTKYWVQLDYKFHTEM